MWTLQGLQLLLDTWPPEKGCADCGGVPMRSAAHRGRNWELLSMAANTGSAAKLSIPFIRANVKCKC